MSISFAKNQARRAVVRAVYNELGIPSISNSEWTALKKKFTGCAYCGGTKKPLTKEHLIGVSENPPGSYHITNIVPVCQPCQHRKNDFGEEKSTQKDWKEHVNSIGKKQNDTEETINSRISEIEKHIASDPDMKKKIQEIQGPVSSAISSFDRIVKTAFKNTLEEAKNLKATKTS
jgi:hypothetical protein